MSEPHATPPDTRFIEALTRHQPVLEAFCHANLARREDAREVLQETNVRLWEKSADWNPDTEFLPWAFAVTRFMILSHVRDRMRDRLVFDPDVVEAMEGHTEVVSTELPERQEALAHCLEEISDEHRALLHAHYVSGRTLRELAAQSSRSESAMKMLMLRVRERLSTCIQRRMGRCPA
jgi:RNA polymerase sigma-70 factor (ECF subfamily)